MRLTIEALIWAYKMCDIKDPVLTSFKLDSCGRPIVEEAKPTTVMEPRRKTKEE